MSPQVKNQKFRFISINNPFIPKMKKMNLFYSDFLKFTFLLFLVYFNLPAHSQVVHYDWPTANGQAVLSDKYRVYIQEGNGPEEEVEVLMSHASGNGDGKWDDLEGRTFSFVNLAYNYTGNNPLTIRVEKTFGSGANDINVFPSSYGLTPSSSSGTETSLVVTSNERYFSVHFESSDNTTAINGWIEHMMVIFIDPLETDVPESNGVVYYSDDLSASDLSNANTIYFAAGYHNLNNYDNGGIIDSDGVLSIQPGQHLYFEGGAFVEGIVDIADRSDRDHKVYGRGILTGRQYLWRKDPNHSGREYDEILDIGTDATINGISLMDSPNHGIVGGNLANIKNVKYLGWHGNNDAIRVGRNSEISHSFIRAVDDHFYNFDIYVHDCVLWAGHNGAILTYGWGGTETSSTYNAGSSIMENIDIIHPEWTSRGNNNGIVASQVGLDFKPYAYDDSAMTVLRNIVIEGSIPALVNLKPRMSDGENIAIPVSEEAVGYLGDLRIENVTVTDVFQQGRIMGELNATTNGNSAWIVKNVVFKDVGINGGCLSADNYSSYLEIDEATTQDIFFNCGSGNLAPNPADISDLQVIATSCSSVDLSWSDIAFEDEYRIRRQELDENGNIMVSYVNLTDVPAGSTSYTDNTATENTIYQYMVRPLQNNTAVALSNTPIITIPYCNTPADIDDLQATATSCNSVALSWSDVDFEDAYRIRRQELDENGNIMVSYVNLTDVPAGSTSYTDNTAVGSTRYQYMVRPVQNNTAVALSNTPILTTATCETPPDIDDLQVTVTSCSTVDLSWSDIDFEDEYRIRRQELDENGAIAVSYVNLTDVPAGSTSYTDLTAQENITYQYMVRPLQNNTAVALSNTPIVTIPSCTSAENSNISCTSTVADYPYLEGFEYGISWTQVSDDDGDWIRDANGTSSGSTGPSDAIEGDYYAYIEASSSGSNAMGSNATAILESPCIDLSSTSSAMFSFHNHMHGSHMGSLTLQASIDGSTWADLWTQSGNQGNQWNDIEVDLNSYAGSVLKLRFVGTTGNSFRSDIAIDDLSITQNSNSRFGEPTDNQDELNAFGQSETFQVYPNPVVRERLNIVSPYEATSYRILDLTGRELSAGMLKNGQVSVTDFRAGAYLIEVSGGNEKQLLRFIRN